MSLSSGEPLAASHFRVFIEGREFGFSEVGRPSSETDLTTAGQLTHRFETVVLRRAVTGARDLYEWRRGIAEGRDDKRTVTIAQLDGPGGRAVNAWQLLRAWPRRWSGPSFHALRAEVAMEELELAFDDLLWIRDLSWLQTVSCETSANPTEGG